MLPEDESFSWQPRNFFSPKEEGDHLVRALASAEDFFNGALKSASRPKGD